MNRTAVGVVLILVAAAGFGTLPIFGTWAEAAGLNNTTMLSYRFLIGSILLLGGLGAVGHLRLLSGRALAVSVALGIMYAGFSGLYFWGLLYIPAGVAGITFYTYPVFVYVLSMVFLGEIVTRRKLLALVLALTGIVLIIGGDTAAINAVGIGLVLLGAFGNAVYVTGGRAVLRSVEPSVFISTTLVVTTVAFFVFGAGTGILSVPQGETQWLIVGGMGLVGTALPLFLYVVGLARIEASKASVIGTTEPVVTVLLGIVLLGESLTAGIIVGGAFVLGGVILIQRAGANDTDAPPADPRGTYPPHEDD